MNSPFPLPEDLTYSQRMEAYKSYLDNANRELLTLHQKVAPIQEVLQKRSLLLDPLIETVFKQALKEAEKKYNINLPRYALLACSSYARQELSPYSDLPLVLILSKIPEHPKWERFTRQLNLSLIEPIEKLRLTISLEIHTLSSAKTSAASDILKLYGFLETRIITGSAWLGKTFRDNFTSFTQKHKTRKTLKKSLALIKERHEDQTNNLSPQTPNLIDGLGGIRDFNTILWLSAIGYKSTSIKPLRRLNLVSHQSYKTLMTSYYFLLNVRSELHLLHSQKIDDLSVESQEFIAKKLGYGPSSPQSFIQDYHYHTKQIHNASNALAKHTQGLLEKSIFSLGFIKKWLSKILK